METTPTPGLVNGKIPAHTVCPFRSECRMAQENHCHHQGVDHKNEFSCAVARAFEMTKNPNL